MGEWLKTIRALAYAAAFVVVAIVGYKLWTGPSSVGSIVRAPIEYTGDVIRTVRGQHEHDLATERPLDFEDEHAAVAIGNDSEGEIANLRRSLMDELMDIVLRHKELGVGFAEGFRKAHLWLPLDWDHRRNVPAATRWTMGWVDRDLERTRKLVAPDILKVARGIVIQKRGKQPDRTKCALHIVRPTDHTLTRFSGEVKAREVNQDDEG